MLTQALILQKNFNVFVRRQYSGQRIAFHMFFAQVNTSKVILPNYVIFESINAVSVCNIVTMIFMILDILSQTTSHKDM